MDSRRDKQKGPRFEKIATEEPSTIADDRDSRFFEFMKTRRRHNQQELLSATTNLSESIPSTLVAHKKIDSTFERLDAHLLKRNKLELQCNLIEQEYKSIINIKLGRYILFFTFLAPAIVFVWNILIEREKNKLLIKLRDQQEKIITLDNRVRTLWEKKYQEVLPDNLLVTNAALEDALTLMNETIKSSSNEALREQFIVFLSNNTEANLYYLYLEIQREPGNKQTLGFLLNQLYPDFIQKIQQLQKITANLEHDFQELYKSVAFENFLQHPTEKNLQLLYSNITKTQSIDRKTKRIIVEHLSELYPNQMRALKSEPHDRIKGVNHTALYNILAKNSPIQSTHPVMTKLILFLTFPNWNNLSILEETMAKHPDYEQDQELNKMIQQMMDICFPSSEQEKSARSTQSESSPAFFKTGKDQKKQDPDALIKKIKGRINAYKIENMYDELPNEKKWDKITEISAIFMNYLILETSDTTYLTELVRFFEKLNPEQHSIPSIADIDAITSAISHLESNHPIRLSTEFIISALKQTTEYQSEDTNPAKQKLKQAFDQEIQYYEKTLVNPKVRKKPNDITWNSIFATRALFNEYIKTLNANPSSINQTERERVNALKTEVDELYRIIRNDPRESAKLEAILAKFLICANELKDHPIKEVAEFIYEHLKKTDEYAKLAPEHTQYHHKH